MHFFHLLKSKQSGSQWKTGLPSPGLEVFSAVPCGASSSLAEGVCVWLR